MWNSINLKNQRTSQNWSFFKKLQKSFATYIGVKCTWCVKKSCNLLYKKT
jgi:hypothetical protein